MTRKRATHHQPSAKSQLQLKLLVTLIDRGNPDSQATKVLYVTPANISVQTMLAQLGRRFDMNCEAAFASEVYNVSADYFVGDVFT